MLTMTLSQHLTLHWLNLQIEATHTQDEGFCHGIGISVFQHPVSSTFSDSRTFEFKGQKPKSKAISCLPETYTNVKPAFLKSKPIALLLTTFSSLVTTSMVKC
jgi:hypothetical protein